MARPKKADIQSDNRREELIVSAARLFRDKGYHGTTMRDIATASHMQPGSPFYHFASKQDLLFAGVERGLNVCLLELEAIDPEAIDALDYFRGLARTHVEHLLMDRIEVAPLMVDEWRHLEGANRDIIIALRRRYEQLWMNAFKMLHDAGYVHRSDKIASRFFLGSLISVIRWYDPAGALKPSAVADSLVDWVIGSQLPHP